MFGKIIYTKEDEVYFVKRVIPESQLKKPDMKVLKKLFHCDTVLRNKGQYYFCQHIKSVEFEEMEYSAIISNSNLYRYELHRTWDIDKGEVLFIMLNPSTANAWKDDLTTIRCINFAKKWGYGGISIGNIYPFRAKRPKDLKKWLKTPNNGLWENRENNISHVRAMASEADLIVCAWGCNYKGGIPDWVEELGNLHYLELCSDGITPKHPLGNLSKDLVPIEFTN